MGRAVSPTDRLWIAVGGLGLVLTAAVALCMASPTYASAVVETCVEMCWTLAALTIAGGAVFTLTTQENR